VRVLAVADTVATMDVRVAVVARVVARRTVAAQAAVALDEPDGCEVCWHASSRGEVDVEVVAAAARADVAAAAPREALAATDAAAAPVDVATDAAAAPVDVVTVAAAAPTDVATVAVAAPADVATVAATVAPVDAATDVAADVRRAVRLHRLPKSRMSFQLRQYR